MENYIDLEMVRDDLIKALKQEIKEDRSGKPKTGVVQISKFKRSNIERYLPQNLLPDRLTLANAFLWDHLRGLVPNALLSELDETVEEIIEDLEYRGIIRRGGQIENLKYPQDDYLTLTIAGVKKLSSGESLDNKEKGE